MVQNYSDEITYFHHIVHINSLWPTIDKMYDAIDGLARVDLGTAILTLSICTSVTFAWHTRNDDTRKLFSSPDEAHAQTYHWLRVTLDVLDHADRVIHASLESIQGIIILFFVACNVEGISQRARALVSRTITIARELSLHRIDSQYTCGASPVAQMSEARAEIARRVWWYLVATDWYGHPTSPLPMRTTS